jgi:hypothetical protein
MIDAFSMTRDRVRVGVRQPAGDVARSDHGIRDRGDCARMTTITAQRSRWSPFSQRSLGDDRMFIQFPNERR